MANDLQVQALGSNDISSDLRERFFEFEREFIRAHDFTGLGHLSKELFKTTEKADERSFVDICHLAVQIVSYCSFVPWILGKTYQISAKDLP